jgi:YgiT-type zinc finger domain-containing protein
MDNTDNIEKPENDEQKATDESLPGCPECHSGVLHLKYITYFTWLSEELITVPNFPSWVCDMCGRREYDPRAVSWLNTLLNPATGRRTTTRRKNRPPAINRPQP